jgi:hypothetical protein
VRIADQDPSVELSVRLGPGPMVEQLKPLSGVPPAEGVRPGVARLRGRGTADRGLLAVNVDAGDTVTGSTSADGTFDLEIGAGPGDDIWFYYDAPSLGDPVWQIVVP